MKLDDLSENDKQVVHRGWKKLMQRGIKRDRLFNSCYSMLSLLRHRCNNTIPWGTTGIPSREEIDELLRDVSAFK